MGAVILAGSVPDFIGSGGGYGYGYGYGDGYGSGSGYGYGDGDGSGYGDYWKATIQYFAAKWTDAQRLRMDCLAAAGATIAFWRSDAAGRAANHARKDPHPGRNVGTVEILPPPLRPCSSGALHATLKPHNFRGERWWIVAMIGEVQHVDDDKIAGLHREILGECL